jgi:hypothetical protein
LQGFWLISAQRADPTYMVMVNEFIKGMMLLVERKFLLISPLFLAKLSDAKLEISAASEVIPIAIL